MLNDLNLNILPTFLLELYKTTFSEMAVEQFEKLHDSELTVDTFSFYTSVSAVFSSKIEGEDVELDSFIKHKRWGVKYQPDYARKIDDLYDAYLFAQKTELSVKAIKEVHATLTKNILQKSGRGKYRSGNMNVLTKDGRIEYVAANPAVVDDEMNRLVQDIEILVKSELSFEETLFFASMLHLVFVKIHPFEDGNGRTRRLLEKWFLAQLLGPKAWFIQSERHYYEQHADYYTNIRRLGLEYEQLDHTKALPFLTMLPNSLRS